LLEVGQNVGITTLIAWLFYSSPVAALLFPVVGYVNGKRRKEAEVKARTARFYEEYRELLSAVSAALENGLSVENGFREAEKTLEMLYGADAMLRADLHTLNHKVAVRVPVEQAFAEFAEAHPYEEVRDFAKIFGFGKRMGGNYLSNLRRSIAKMEESIEVRQEIATNLAEKRLELRVMSVMPLGILGYIRLSSPDFMEPLYHNVLGYGVMSGCLAVYALCLFFGKRIVEIEV
jgi:tight adherence protein B